MPERLPDQTPVWDLSSVISGLQAERERWRTSHCRSIESGGREFPAPPAVHAAIKGIVAALFPMRLGPDTLRKEAEDYFVGSTLSCALGVLYEQARLELGGRSAATDPRAPALREAEAARQAETIIHGFAAALPAIRRLLDSDVEAAYRGDPAATSVDEILLCYPGVAAVIHHRVAHDLFLRGIPLVARIITEIAHSETGIDIHPGATVGESFFIDHGTGVVIGATAVIGRNVRLYQNVTLGAKRLVKGDGSMVDHDTPRHPIVEDDVVIYAGATILGRVTIGAGSVIGGNVWLTHSIPPGSQITQAQSQAGPEA
ncbi:MAG: serine acetyltransferase [Pseudomonadota bacterium]|nr:serine acetyltransferase [Pseudomonadota bacterium]